MTEQRTAAMRRVFEIFTAAGWIEKSMVSSQLDDMLWQPTDAGMQTVPHILTLLREMDEDQSGEMAACTLFLCKEFVRVDNWLVPGHDYEE